MTMKQSFRLAFILVILCATASGIWLWRTHRTTISDSELVLYGNVNIRQVELAINGSERIASLLVEEGDRIKQGQLLAKLETERFELAVARADAQVKTQEGPAGAFEQKVTVSRWSFFLNPPKFHDLQIRCEYL